MNDLATPPVGEAHDENRPANDGLSYIGRAETTAQDLPPRTAGNIKDFSKRWVEGKNVIDTLEQAIRECDTARQTAPSKLFDRMLDQAVREMQPAYPLYLALIAGGEEAMKRARKHPVFKDRSRGLQKGTEATVAAKIILDPDNGDEKQISDYAAMLIYAAGHDVDPDCFVAELSKVKFKACRAFASGVRGRKKRSGGAAAAVKQNSPTLTVSVTLFDANGHQTNRHWQIDEAKVDAIIATLGDASSNNPQQLFEILSAVMVAKSNADA
ncbi:hypothetical protein [Mesorhizobium sp. M0030]|uniref:hypothetical protein n=1 Tax=Mesorhizobium sp. M0030 TaxID=2956851 RepID=UPI00333D27D5